MSEVRAVMARRWRWGASDCWCSACDVAVRLTGSDPMAPLRGTYASEAEAAALVARYGGMAEIASLHFELAGWRRVQSPEAGDLGLGPGRDGPTLRVCVGGLWAGKTVNAFALVPGWTLAWRF